MDRRSFIKKLLAASVAAQFIDVEELLWTPGQMIAVPGNFATGGMLSKPTLFQFDALLTSISVQYMGGMTFIAEKVFPPIPFEKGDGISVVRHGDEWTARVIRQNPDCRPLRSILSDFRGSGHGSGAGTGKTRRNPD
jgi:hypothetical protein